MFHKKKSFQRKKVGRFSLGFKLSLSITLLVMLLMICIGINSYLRNRTILLQEAQSRGWMTARTTSAFAADYLRGYNPNLQSNIIDHLERDPFIKRVAILDINGVVLKSSDESMVQKKMTGQEVQEALIQKKDTLKYISDIKGHPLTMEFISPVAARNEAPLGYFWIEADLTYISAHLINTARNQIITSLLAILAGLILSRLIIIRVIQRPIKELVQATDRVSTGDFSGRVHVYNQDELGKLANAFNTMTDHLGVLFQSIRTAVNDINHTTMLIINRSEQSDLATRKLTDSLNQLQQTAAQLPNAAQNDIPLECSNKLHESTETTLRQQEHLKEIRSASRKLIRYVDRLDSISLQFKFNEK
ncbi:putative methyl-accepting chemotaxis sensory transducer [Desulforamulus reducens MI-1]|uniref:histidine kinase n=1 Tax=Desulforamulus reducens (strain ATCC BAA-1160 / DSM 100696 / MI-1) TaxID=349161 RepID=A4J6D4_DESRM|nr:HAMP domain-containing protein [Desulforamulus reducens]ABO50637.1 putative methyl-accepting chemotaxis sensory transducer [Desulforamulus reducens MI-1]